MAAAPGELLGTCAAAAVVSEPLAAPSSPSTTTGGVTLGVGWDVADASGDRVACAEAEDVAAEEAEANEEKVATPERVLVVEGVCEGDTVVLGVPVPDGVAVPVGVGEGVDAGVPVPDKELEREVEGVLEADAPGDSEEVGDTLLVLLALTVVEGVDGGVTVALGE